MHHPPPGDELELMLADQASQDPAWQPTPFWQAAVPMILADLRTHGVDSFRRHNSAAGLYAPRYQPHPGPQPGRTRAAMQDIAEQAGLPPKTRRDLALFWSGESAALADYRVFRAADLPGAPDLLAFSEPETPPPAEQFVIEGRRYSRSSLNYLRGLAFFKRHARPRAHRRVIEVGGGFGSLGEILLRTSPAFYLDCDLPPLAHVTTAHLRSIFGVGAVAGYRETRDLDPIDVPTLAKRYRAVVICPWQLPRVRGRFDLAVNYISFQEMEPDTVRRYAHHLQPLVRHHLLLRNSPTGKQRRTPTCPLGVDEPVTRDLVLEAFDQFQPVAADTLTFGQLHPDGHSSEVLLLRRRKPPRSA